MTKTLERATLAAAELSPGEKFVLAGLLLDSAEGTADPDQEVEAAWEVEIQKRICEIQSGRAQGITLAEMNRKIEALLAK
jgi:hypothetical protein